MIRYLYLIFVVFFTAMAVTGCASLSRPDPDRRHYLLRVERPDTLESAAAPVENVLAVRTFRVASAYDARGMLTALPGGRVERHFYEQFFLLPGDMITSQFREWLQATGLFSVVSDLGVLVEPDLILEGFVQELYRDFRGNTPRAVLAIQLLLLRPDGAGAMDVVLQDDYRQVLDLPDSSIQTLVSSWNLALEQILSQFEIRLRTMEAGAWHNSEPEPVSTAAGSQ